MHIYRCETDGFAAEIHYIFHSTKNYYSCGYKIADKWEDIPHYKLGEIAGMQFDDVSYLTKALIWFFE